MEFVKLELGELPSILKRHYPNHPTFFSTYIMHIQTKHVVPETSPDAKILGDNEVKELNIFFTIVGDVVLYEVATHDGRMTDSEWVALSDMYVHTKTELWHVERSTITDRIAKIEAENTLGGGDAER